MRFWMSDCYWKLSLYIFYYFIVLLFWVPGPLQFRQAFVSLRSQLLINTSKSPLFMPLIFQGLRLFRTIGFHVSSFSSSHLFRSLPFRLAIFRPWLYQTSAHLGFRFFQVFAISIPSFRYSSFGFLGFDIF